MDIKDCSGVADFVEELASNPMYLHLCEGKPLRQAGNTEWHSIPAKGDKSYHPDLSETTPYWTKQQYDQYTSLRNQHNKLSTERDKLWGEMNSLERRLLVWGRKSKRAELAQQLDRISEQLNNCNYQKCIRLVGGTLRTGMEVVHDTEEYRGSKNFQGWVLGFTVGQSYVFQLLYGDNTNDSRPDTYTTYGLLIPKDKVSVICPRIEQDPRVLIDSFRKTFPECDNSKGTLAIGAGPKYVKIDRF